jgi:hypothetical protein
MEEVERSLAANSKTADKYADYSDNQKTLLIYYLKLKLSTAAGPARKAAVNVRCWVENACT